MNYEQQIKSPLWQRKRLEIMQLADFTCELCKSKEKTLNIHHLKYIQGNYIYQYPNNYLICICEDCHKVLHKYKIEKPIKAEIAKPKITTIDNDVIEEISIKDYIKQQNKKICKNCQLLEVFDRSENGERIEMYACSEKGILQSTLTKINKKTLKTKIDKKCYFPIDKNCCEMFKIKEG